MLHFHFFLSHKGGVGKSWSCIQLASYLQDYLELKIFCFDTDPQNQTLSKYKAFPIKVLKLLDSDTNTINTRNYDDFIDKELPNLPENTSHVLIDVGSSSYLTLLSYMNENALVPMLQAFGKVYIHCSLNGGQAYDETITCVKDLAQIFQYQPLIIWENRHLAGQVVNAEGIHFLNDPLYHEAISKAHKVFNIAIPFLNKDTYGKDLEALSAKNLSINEAQKDPRYASSIMVKQRLVSFQRMMFAEIDKASFIKKETGVSYE